ncbi:unnamed protein product [Bursaphelenchus xylophilus]|uniref:Mediator of RNA polymerase II transcription subunit 7 n=1 Tax=Bursaphelenchus xylophilus TaxID=6326 RepID=A0A1I7RSC3_BURXY|nr:unnamed protein product [Bursaphelenchus xylophilus]CAG9123054.1 unnamed protein product [Bursaphelenchus xylophilus]
MLPQNVSPYPSPPEYALNYTNDNIRSGSIPKPPPVPLKFKVFNEEYNLEGPMMPSLQDLEITKYYNSKEPWKAELRKLNFSVVAAFLDLLDILIKNPQHPERKEKIETIRTLFINMHHLINERRPVQARETLVEMMRKQNRDLSNVITRLKLLLSNVGSKLNEMHKEIEECTIELTIPECSTSSISPPEHKVMTYNIIQDRRLTKKQVKMQEFKCKDEALLKHMKLLTLAEEDKTEYTDTFNDDDLADVEENVIDEEENEESTLSESSEINEDDFIEDDKSSESEEAVKDSVMDVTVEYMDDDEDDEDEDEEDLDDVMDDSDEDKASGSPQSAISAENTSGLEPPSEFVDDKPRPEEPMEPEINMMPEQENSQQFPMSPELDNQNDSGDNSDPEAVQ